MSTNNNVDTTSSRRYEFNGYRAATFYSLIGTAKLNGLNPEAYLRYVLEHIADHPITRIQELLPWNIVGSVPTASEPAG